MRARVVDWSLLILVVAEVVSGLWSFTVGKPAGRWLFWLHGAVGLALLPLLGYKFARVARRVVEPQRWQWATPVSLLTALAAFGTVGIGVYWVLWQSPVAYPNGMILHTASGLVLLGLIVWHMGLRYKPLTRRDLADRRSALRLGGVVVGGLALWATVEMGNRAARLPGTRRRFTGSRLAGESFPVTMWMLDRPVPLDAQQYRLAVDGQVRNPLQLSLDQLGELPTSALTATLDCTGGWYTEQAWQGIAVADLLARAEPVAAARYVRFRSVTGYRWALPIAEARTVLLATHVGGAALTHGHGAPLRLVAPGRRGFQWVKWVVGVEVLSAPDAGQWAAIFTSGLARPS